MKSSSMFVVLVASAALGATACLSGTGGVEVSESDGDATRVDTAAATSDAAGGSASDGGDGGTATSASAASAPLRVVPSVAYAAYDGTHDVVVPVALYGAGAADAGLAATAAYDVAIRGARLVDPSADPGVYHVVRTRGAEDVAITATSGAAAASMTIVVASVTPAQYQAGEARFLGGGADGAASCASCHAASGPTALSPLVTSRFPDARILDSVTRGFALAGTAITAVDHRFVVAGADEGAGLVAYVRNRPAGELVEAP